MMRTTVDIDEPVLAELKKLQKQEGKSLGRLISDLLLEALRRRGRGRKAPPFSWHSSKGRLVVDPLDKDEIYRVLDAERAGGE